MKSDIPLPTEGTLLLIEDDSPVRGAVARGLRAAHYDVHGYRSGEEAVEFVRAYAGPIDLLITDAQLRGGNGINGFAAAEAIRAMRPSIPVLQMSRSPKSAVKTSPTSGPVFHFIAKPFRLAALLNTVRTMVGDRASIGMGS